MIEEDPIVEDVRRAGEAYLREFQYDLRAAMKDLQRRSIAAGRTVVSLPPKKPIVRVQTTKKAG